MTEPHSHNDIELNYIVGGTVTYLLGGRSLSLTTGGLHVFWAAVPHQIIHLDEATRYFVFHFPLTCFLQWQLLPHFSRQVLRGDLLTTPVGDKDFQLAQCERWHGYIGADTTEHHKIALLEIEACLRLMALSSEAPAPVGSPDLQTGIDSIARMASYIAGNFQEPLSVTQIAASVNLHPNYAMQLFRQHTGRTLISYLTQYRIAHAQHLLLTTNKTVLDVALESGFSSLSRFYAVFKEFCHIAPTRYRQSLRSGSRHFFG
jgi:AraC-like DNA-binding protein